MEDMSGYTILRKQLMAGIFRIEIAESIAQHLAIIHRETHVSRIGDEGLAQIDKEFE